MHEALRREPSDLIGGRWRALEGDGLRSVNPAFPDELIWAGTPRTTHVSEAVAEARKAAPKWAAWEPARRHAVIRTFAERCMEAVDRFAALICDETGKALWDARAEASLLAAKVGVTLDASEHGPMRRVSGFELSLGETKKGRCWFRPHGVMAVLGPFNFPAHLPNGHIVPALAMGNCVVFKPSDKAPAVGQAYAELLQEVLDEADAPPGVLSLVQGGADVASALATADGIDGILFTGSWPVGRQILEANLDRPGRIIALEMGGNSPSVVMPDADLRQAAIEIARSAFVSCGQRCTCTRRLIVHEDVADTVVESIIEIAKAMRIGIPRGEPPVFMGPLINEYSRDSLLASQHALREAGGDVLLESFAPKQLAGGEKAGRGTSYITPGVIRVDRFVKTGWGQPGAKSNPGRDAGCDEEFFGPLLRVSSVSNLDDAIAQANATRYGLAASIFSQKNTTIDRFLRETRAGCINVNTGTAGASGKLPFGGLGLSGNHRPAGAFSLDYCAYPVAGMVEEGDAAARVPGMTLPGD